MRLFALNGPKRRWNVWWDSLETLWVLSDNNIREIFDIVLIVFDNVLLTLSLLKQVLRRRLRSYSLRQLLTLWMQIDSASIDLGSLTLVVLKRADLRRHWWLPDLWGHVHDPFRYGIDLRIPLLRNRRMHIGHDFHLLLTHVNIVRVMLQFVQIAPSVTRIRQVCLGVHRGDVLLRSSRAN